MTRRATPTEPTALRRDVVRTALDRLWEYRNAPPRAMDPAGRAMDRMRDEVARYGWALQYLLRYMEETHPHIAPYLARNIAQTWDSGTTEHHLKIAAEQLGWVAADGTIRIPAEGSGS